jgi:hypothetical protein
MQVVVQQPPSGGIRVHKITRRQDAGMLAEQVVQAVATQGGFSDQMLIIEILQVTACLIQAGFVECGGGISVDIGARVQAKPTK